MPEKPAAPSAIERSLQVSRFILDQLRYGAEHGTPEVRKFCGRLVADAALLARAEARDAIYRCPTCGRDNRTKTCEACAAEPS